MKKEYMKYMLKSILLLFLFRFAYLFAATLIGIGIVTLYSYFWYLDINSPNSTLVIAGIFAAFIITDFILLYNERWTPTLIFLLIIITPIRIIYKILKNVDLFDVNSSIPGRVKKYVMHELRIIFPDSDLGSTFSIS